MKTLEEISLLDLLPASISRDATVQAIAKAIDPQLKIISETVDAPAIYSNIDKLPGDILDHLAVQYDVATWRDHWSLAMKRSIIKTAIADKRIVGTVAAIENAIKSLGSSARIVEWWQTEPKGTPHTFKIYVSLNDVEGTVTEQMQEDIILLIDAAKPLRSHYDMILTRAMNGGLGIHAELRSVTYSRI